MKIICRMLCVLLVVSCLPGAYAEVFLGEPPAEWADRSLLVWTIFDVNEGDAHLLQCGGEAMLVDGGPYGFREDLRAALESRGLKNRMKYILNTHYHDDHIDGIDQLFRKGFTAGEFLHPYNDWAIRNSKLGTQTVNAAKRAGVPVRRVQPGDELTLGDASIEFFQHADGQGTNARSLVLKVSFGSTSILMCADITGQTQRHFLKTLSAEDLKADLLKVPHHAATPMVSEFLDAVDPLAAIVTNRKKDVPSRSVIQLEGCLLPALYSGDGTCYAVTDGTDWYLYQTPGQF